MCILKTLFPSAAHKGLTFCKIFIIFANSNRPQKRKNWRRNFFKPLTWLHLYHCHKLDPRCFKYQLFHNLIWLIYSCGSLLLFLLFFFQCNRWDSEEIGLLLLLQKAGKRIIAFLHLCEPIFFNFYLVSLAFYLFYPFSSLSVWSLKLFNMQHPASIFNIYPCDWF